MKTTTPAPVVTRATSTTPRPPPRPTTSTSTTTPASTTRSYDFYSPNSLTNDAFDLFGKKIATVYNVDNSTAAMWAATFRKSQQHEVYVMDERALEQVPQHRRSEFLFPGTPLYRPAVDDFDSNMAKFTYHSSIEAFPRILHKLVASHSPLINELSGHMLAMVDGELQNYKHIPTHTELRRRITRDLHKPNPVISRIHQIIPNMTARGETDYSWSRISQYYESFHGKLDPADLEMAKAYFDFPFPNAPKFPETFSRPLPLTFHN